MNVSDLTEEILHDNMKILSNYDEAIKFPYVWENFDRQKRLLSAVLANPEVFEKYLQKETAGNFEAYASEQIVAALNPDEDEEEILMPVIESMDKEGSEHFKKSIQKRVFYENLAEFSKCFTIMLNNVNIVKVEPE